MRLSVNFKSTLNQLSIMLIILSLLGCNKKQTVITAMPDSTPIVDNSSVIDLPAEKIPVIMPEVKINETILFDLDRANIRANQVSILDGIVLKAHKAPFKTLVLTGGCCWLGETDYNLGLGYARANSVKAYLQQYLKNPIIVQSVGESQLVTTLEDEIFLNRRVEAHFE